MTWLQTLLSAFNHEELSLIFSAALYRYPILIIGDTSDDSNNIADNISQLVYHRHRAVFWSDFISEEELHLLLEEESTDPRNNRVVVLSYAANTFQAITQFQHFKSWIMAFVPKSNLDLSTVFEKIYRSGLPFLSIQLMKPKNKMRMYARDQNIITKLTRDILSKVTTHTKQSITKLARIISKKKVKSIDLPELDGFLEFNEETEYIQKDVFEKELMDFVHAARRAFILFNRIRVMAELGTQIKIDSQTLMEAIGFDKTYVKDLLTFLIAEYDDDFSFILDNSRVSRFGDQVDSLWGIAR
jgi:hypothetical protein